MDVDIDNDFDGKLLDQFRSLGTTDRDVLIAEFQALLGNKLNPESCAFFLDMNNWNLQNAVCSYYDFEQPANSLPSMTILGDVTIGDGESVAPNTTFVKTWRIKNQGMDRWPPGCHLRFCSGDNLATIDRRMVDALSPGEMMDVHVEMKSPSSVGSYLSLWRMCTPTGSYFGDVINVQINVAEGGLLGLTQQLSRIGGEFAHQPTPVSSSGTTGPFSTPSIMSPSTELSRQQQQQQLSSQQQLVLFTGNPALLHNPSPSSPTVLSNNEEDAEMS